MFGDNRPQAAGVDLYEAIVGSKPSLDENANAAARLGPQGAVHPWERADNSRSSVPKPLEQDIATREMLGETNPVYQGGHADAPRLIGEVPEGHRGGCRTTASQ